LAILAELHGRDQAKFEEVARTVRGRKRPYITHDSQLLRSPERIPSSSSLYCEANLGANPIAKLCYTVLLKMGYPEPDLTFETE